MFTVTGCIFCNRVPPGPSSDNQSGITCNLRQQQLLYRYAHNVNLFYTSEYDDADHNYISISGLGSGSRLATETVPKSLLSRMRDSPTSTPLCISVPTLTPISTADAGGRATSKTLATSTKHSASSRASKYGTLCREIAAWGGKGHRGRWKRGGAEEVEGYTYGDYHRRW